MCKNYFDIMTTRLILTILIDKKLKSRMQTIRYFIFLLLILSATCFAGTAQTWRLIYSSNFQGELKPCGCSVQGNLGGVLRRATILAEYRNRNIPMVLLSAGDLLGATDEQGILKSNYMLQAIKLLGYDAIMPGEMDLAHSPQLLAKYKLPWILSNANTNKIYKLYRVRKLTNQQRVIILALLDPDLVSSKHKQLLKNPLASLKRALKKSNAASNDIIILLVHGSAKFVNELGAATKEMQLVDIIVRGHLTEPVKKPLESVSPLILTAGHRGQRIGLAQFGLAAKPKMLSNSIIPLPSSIKDDPTLTKIYARYDQAIRRWYLARTKNMKLKKVTNRSFAGSNECGSCHLKEFAIWNKSKHANALTSLKNVNKQFDPECLACHTTGMNQKGGFISINLTPKLANVQCETCHGPGRQHARYPKSHRLKNGFAACPQCHTKENSPAFNLISYWKKVVHSRSHELRLHNQALSKISGVYDVIDEQKPLVTTDKVELQEYFNFYCHRCYVLNASWSQLVDEVKFNLNHKQIPITFGAEQKPWAAIAYLLAVEKGLGEKVKTALFQAHFENHIDINRQTKVLGIVKQWHLDKELQTVFNNKNHTLWKRFRQGQRLKKKQGIYATPTIIINNNLRVLPKHTGDNTNLLIDNLKTILLDMKCRQLNQCE